jgi:hypothetical protein
MNQKVQCPICKRQFEFDNLGGGGLIYWKTGTFVCADCVPETEIRNGIAAAQEGRFSTPFESLEEFEQAMIAAAQELGLKIEKTESGQRETLCDFIER